MMLTLFVYMLVSKITLFYRQSSLYSFSLQYLTIHKVLVINELAI